MAPVLSVVVPIFNVERYLAECLTSLAGQSFANLEIICVDDGSQDGSAQVAKEFAARDTRFHVIHQDNQGPGPAKNAGLLKAAGEYLAFVDGDDILTPDAFRLLVGSLRATGSDIACGAVHRFNADMSRPSWLHASIFTTPRRRTHIRRYPQLAVNRTVWNQVYRRAFWDAHQFQFADALYEDVMVAVPAQVRAAAVDILTDVVYRWRERGPDEPPSITQRSAEPPNAIDRMDAVATLSAYLRANAPEARPVHDRLVIDRDLRVLCEALPYANAEQRDRLLGLAMACLTDVDPAAMSELYERDPAHHERLLYLTGQGSTISVDARKPARNGVRSVSAVVDTTTPRSR